MPDIHIVRHDDRWAVKESADATPIFEAYTLEEARSDAISRAAGGRVLVEGEDNPEGVGRHTVGTDVPLEPHEVRERATPVNPGERLREQQGGL